ncbi:MAG TPA: protein translocase subunit SecF [Propionibacteriaceae bacterium]|nr:protein translocase subunit SecF [Propionibacteriaceae bacterium]
MARLGSLTHRLYTGEVSYDFIGRRRRWYLLSAILIALSLIALLVRGLVFGIEFRGGADFKAPTTVTSSTVDSMREALDRTGLPDLDDSIVNTIGDNQVRVQTRPLDSTTEVPVVRSAIAEEVGIAPDEVAYSLIGASWGSQITERGLIALAVFLALVGLVIWVYFRDAKMSVAALIALVHDLVLTVGIYALVGFTVTPATLIGILTILGYSLYDTVVVFDKVRENVRDIKSSTTKTYSEAANLAVNQVLVRSINTTVIGVLPVAALLFAGAVILGEGPLKDLALALFVGMVSGAYSSIFIATPLLAQLREREPDMKKLASRVAARRSKEIQKGRPAEPAVEAAGFEPVPEPAIEPNEEELAEAVLSARTGIKISRVSGAERPDVRPLSEGAAKRPQPQHKSRSQRKK